MADTIDPQLKRKKIGHKFIDTFKDAAKTTGELNAILGSNMSANEMLMATEEERIELLIRTMQAQGRQFNEMDRFTQKAIAARLGITDLNEAQRILGMYLSSYKRMKREAAAAAKVNRKQSQKDCVEIDSQNY